MFQLTYIIVVESRSEVDVSHRVDLVFYLKDLKRNEKEEERRRRR